MGQLTENAERLRQEIKSLLPDARECDRNEPGDISFSKDRQGNTLYAGAVLKAKVEGLVREMKIGEVCLHIVAFAKLCLHMYLYLILTRAGVGIWPSSR